MTAVLAQERGDSTRKLVAAVIAGGIITSISLGTRYSFGLFLDPVIETLGTDKGAFSLVIAVQNIVWGLSQPLAGAIADRYGTGRVLSAGGLAYFGSLLMMSTADSSGVLLLSAGFLTGAAVSAASFTVVLSAVGRMAPPAQRSMALGVVSAAGSIGQFVIIPLTRQLLDSGTWRSTAVVLAFMTLAILVFAPVLRGSASDQQSAAEKALQGEGNGLRVDLQRAAASRSYLLLNLGFFVCGFHVVFIGTHLASYARDVNVSDSAAAQALALIGLFNVFGSLTAGFLGGRYNKSNLLAGLYGLRGVFILGYLLIPVSDTTTLIFGATIGLLWLSTVPLTSGIVNQMFGTRNAGTLFGIVFLSHQMGSFLGAWLAGEISDRTGSYNLAWWIAIGLAVMATVCHLLIDDGPVPRAPAEVSFRFSPASGLATIVVVAGISGALMSARPTLASAGSAPLPGHVCILGPTPLSG